MHRSTALFVVAWLLAGVGTVQAAPPAHPVVPGFERFPNDVARSGQLLLGELNCVSCHQAEGATARKQAPILDGLGGRMRLGHLRKFLSDPHGVKPGTTMPALFAGDPERERKVEALVHYLASTGSLKQERPDVRAVSAGRDLYHKIGCVACHGTRDTAGLADKVIASSVPLGDLKAKYSLSGLVAFLENPQHVRPSGRMPKLVANTKEAREVANYLLQGLKVDLGGVGAANYSYYEGDWDTLPDFAKLKPSASGVGPALDVNLARRNNNFALKFEGVFRVDKASDGDYTFSLSSDDGSRLEIDGKTVVNNDGIHPTRSVTGKTRLTKGVHKATVYFFQGGGEVVLEATMEAPGQPALNFASLLAATEEGLDKKPAIKPAQPEDVIEIQPELVVRGKELFRSAGCASCHQLNDGGKALTSTLSAPALNKLKGEGGCLSASPARGLPTYALSQAQTKALTAAIKNPPPTDNSPAGVLRQTLTTLNCYACHSRDKIGGPEEALDKFFLTTQPEMGDEGRVPPPLDGVGAKLRRDYMEQLLDKGTDDRPYMHTRMPGFGKANVAHLVDVFASLDKLPSVAAVTFKESEGRVKDQARHLTGGLAFGCIKCHTFNGQKAEGVQGIDMTLMPRRLQRDWFHAYVAEPQRIRPGTRMPTAFENGKSILAGVFDGKADAQIESMWLYLQDGSKARLPLGMGKKSIPLVPTDGAIVYRNFLEGSGQMTRGIAVGYPEKAHLAFDANEMKLALLWQGAFLDAAKHWTDRGSGWEGPLGDNILHLHGGAPFAVLATKDEAWPSKPARDLGYRFLGYRLTPDDRPTFQYSQGELRIDDFPNAKAGKEPSLTRKLSVEAAKPTDGVYFRAALGSKVETLGDGWFKIDGTWKIKVAGGEAMVRQSGGKAELLVALRFKDSKAEIVLDYVW